MTTKKFPLSTLVYNFCSDHIDETKPQYVLRNVVSDL